jgi:dihydropteroate synthase
MVYSVLMVTLDRWVAKRDRVLVMGIINVTPDSFFSTGRTLSPRLALEYAQRMVAEGADIIDIGGESSRPGSSSVTAQEELKRVLPVMECIHSECDVVLSVDTTKVEVARQALDCGASIINDISALRADPNMKALAAERGAFVVLMHMQGVPRTMQAAPQYEDVTGEVLQFLEERAREAVRGGIARERLFIDPGIGFGKRLEHNLTLLRDIRRFAATGIPVLVGVSRKSFLGELLGLPASDRLEGTLAAEAVAVAAGADVLRVHDVKEGRRAADVARRLRSDAA